MKIAIVGCTGLVGSVILKVLRELKLPITSLLPVASEKSIGKEIWFNNQSIKIIGIEEALQEKPAMAIFSAGGTISRKWAKTFAENGITVIDNSSAWRMDEDVPLVVPEINGHLLTPNDKIIANPNCSTIQMLVALKPIYDAVGIERITVSTYQAVSGSGTNAVNELAKQTAELLNGRDAECDVYPRQIAFNVLPHIDIFMDNGYTKEEMKMCWETQKIFGDENIAVSATCVRVPVFFGHSEAIQIETSDYIDEKQARSLLEKAEGVTVIDERRDGGYPTAVHESAGSDPVFVGRIRKDISLKNGLNLWVVSDNVRKGAALNSIQIAEELIKTHLN